jgi:GxxExxY protein
VQDRIIVELKAVDRLLPIHEAQLLTYLKLAQLEVGLLVNFNVRVLKSGLRRLSPRPSPFPPSQLLVHSKEFV